jgi:hypothetical protein
MARKRANSKHKSKVDSGNTIDVSTVSANDVWFNYEAVVPEEDFKNSLKILYGGYLAVVFNFLDAIEEMYPDSKIDWRLDKSIASVYTKKDDGFEFNTALLEEKLDAACKAEVKVPDPNKEIRNCLSTYYIFEGKECVLYLIQNMYEDSLLIHLELINSDGEDIKAEDRIEGFSCILRVREKDYREFLDNAKEMFEDVFKEILKACRLFI